MAAAFGGEDAESYYDEGLTASVKGELERAAAHFEKAIRLDNSMAVAYHQLGRCYTRMGEYKKAVKLLTQVAQKRPTLLAARLDLATALLGLGMYNEARKQLHGVLSVQAGNVKALLGLAQADLMQQDYEGALSYGQTAQSIGANNFSVLLLVGRAAKMAGHAEQSVRALQKADKVIEKFLETNPDKPEGHFLRGEIALVLEKYPAALQHFRDAEDRADSHRAYQAYNENFTMADILANQAICLERTGKHDRAAELRDRVRALTPDHPGLKTQADA